MGNEIIKTIVYKMLLFVRSVLKMLETEELISEKAHDDGNNVKSMDKRSLYFNSEYLWKKDIETPDINNNHEEDFEFFLRLRFNPCIDPTVLYLSKDFIFRVELKQKKTVCDPVFIMNIKQGSRNI